MPNSFSFINQYTQPKPGLESYLGIILHFNVFIFIFIKKIWLWSKFSFLITEKFLITKEVNNIFFKLNFMGKNETTRLYMNHTLDFLNIFLIKILQRK